MKGAPYPRLAFIVKRHYSNQDLLKDAFGRYGNLPPQLAERGWKVTIFSVDFHGREEALVTAPYGIPHHTFPTKPLLPPPTGLRQAVRTFSPELVICGGHVHMGSLARRALGSSKIPVIFDHYDFYPAFFPRWAEAFAKTMWRRSMAASDGFIEASPSLEELLKKNLPNRPHLVVRNGYDPALFYPRSAEPNQLRVHLPDTPKLRTLGYFGGATDYVALPEVISALDALEAGSGLHTQLIHAGKPIPGPHSPRYQAIGSKSQEKIPALAAACDLVLAPYRNCLQVKYSNACKLAETAALRLPIVASRNGDWNSVIERDYPGLYDPEDASSLKKALERQLLKPIRLQPRPELTWSAQADRLDAWLQSLLRKAH
jgi:glycosyltransferase involved in cell wall biosynthesis